MTATTFRFVWKNHSMALRFPPPRIVVEENSACFIVKDHAGLSLAHVYFEDEPGRRLLMT